MGSEINFIKKEIVSLFGLDFYNAYVENSDGISGKRFVRDHFSPNEIINIYEIEKGERFIRFEEKFKDEPFFANVLSLVLFFQEISSKILDLEQEWESSFLDNREEIEKEYVKRLNLKMNTNYDIESLFSDERVKKEMLDKMRSRWQKAYSSNYKNSLDDKFWKFEENVGSNIFLSTMKYF